MTEPPKSSPAIFRASSQTGYNFSFMSLSLRPDLARTLAEIFLEEKDWTRTKARVLATNALQCRSSKTAARIERELRHRLETLTAAQLRLLAAAPAEDRAAIAWLATLKHSRFAFEFAAEVLRDKIAVRDPILRYSDFESFVELKSLLHQELASLTPTARNRVRQVLQGMLAEVGLIGVVRNSPSVNASTVIHRPVVSPPVLESIISDNPRWLAGFLVTDEEIGGYRWGRP